MPKKLPPMQIEIVPGDQYESIDIAWRAALPGLAEDLASTIHRLLDSGYFIVQNGEIIINPERKLRE